MAFCLTSKMSHDYGRRDGCFAAGMTDVGVGSGDLLGFSVLILKGGHATDDEASNGANRENDDPAKNAGSETSLLSCERRSGNRCTR